MGSTFKDDDIVILSAKRSIIGSDSGSIKDVGAVDLSAHVLNNIFENLEKQSSGFHRSKIDYFVCGLSIGAGIGQNPPRQIANQVGLKNIPVAFAVNEMCGSGMQSIILGIQALRTGDSEMAIVGGTESVSMSPYLITAKQLVEWQDLRVEEIQTKVVRADVYDGLTCKIHDVHTICHAENCTQRWAKEKKLNPDDFKLEVDDYAFLSHQRALKAIEEHKFDDEMVLIPGTSERDELPSRKNIKIMNRRKGTQFTPDGLYLSNHNSPQLGNGAAFMVLTTYKKAKSCGLESMAKIVDYAKAGTSPEDFMLAPLAAMRQLFGRTQTNVDDFDYIESNSAFGSQMLINKIELGLDMDKVNVNGDCIALGHPIGAAGARILTTLLYTLIQNNKSRGLASICLGGGNGSAMSIEINNP